MRTKSAYREPVAEIPATELPPEASTEQPNFFSDLPPPAIEAATEIESPQPESNAAAEAEQSAIEADAASEALKAQLAALRSAEALQRQPAPQPQPTSREEKLAMWKTQGMSEAEERFLAEHPLMVDHPGVLTQAIGTTVRAGVSRDDPSFLSKVRANFDFHLQRFQRQAAEQSPAFFKPEPPPAMPSKPTPASFVSAPPQS
jgi:hypothetical protein